MGLRIALLNASYDDSNTARNFGRELDGDLSVYSAVDRELPTSYEFDAVVVTGSRASVYEEEPWVTSSPP